MTAVFMPGEGGSSGVWVDGQLRFVSKPSLNGSTHLYYATLGYQVLIQLP